jgi:choline monooxygenase
VTCPYHGLKFNSLGECDNARYHLASKPVAIQHGMIFTEVVAFDFPIDLSHMTLVEQRVDNVKCTPSIVLDVFLDIDHIPVAHPGVYDAIDITDISKIDCDVFDGGSYQRVPADNDAHMIDADKQYGLGAMWVTLYPNITIEWQPGALFVNVALTKGEYTDVVVYKYRDTRYNDDSWTLNSDVWETAWAQDRELCERIVALPSKNIPLLKLHHLHALGR